MPDNSDQRRLLIEAFNEIAREQDRLVLALSGGALVLSIAFLSDIATPQPEKVWLLVGAWIFFGLSLAALLASHPVAKTKAIKAIAQIDEELKGEHSTTNIGSIEWTSILNYSALVLLLVGLTLLIVFASINVM